MAFGPAIVLVKTLKSEHEVRILNPNHGPRRWAPISLRHFSPAYMSIQSVQRQTFSPLCHGIGKLMDASRLLISC